MPLVARAELDIDRPAAELWATLSDFGAWERFMPSGFRPASGPRHTLVVGDRMAVTVGLGMTLALEVVRVAHGHELCWRGGVPGLLVGEHAFYFDDLGDGRTRARSEEPFAGMLAHVPLLGRAIERGASAAGRKMLEALASASP